MPEPDEKSASLSGAQAANEQQAQKSAACLEEAKVTEKLAESCGDLKEKDKLLSIAGLWRELARMRQRLSGKDRG